MTIWEHDEDNEHDHVADLEGTVENGKIAINWKVVYTEDNDDSTSGKELAEKGYTLPEYHFVAEYDGVKSEKSPVMEVRGRAKLQLVDGTGNPLPDTNYVLYLADVSIEKGVSDSMGYVNVKNVPFGITSISIDRNNYYA